MLYRLEDFFRNTNGKSLRATHSCVLYTSCTLNLWYKKAIVLFHFHLSDDLLLNFCEVDNEFLF